MTVKIVTDSTADLPADLAQELGITVVPLHINFGTDSYIDGIDLNADQFYEKLTSSPSLPTTSQPSPDAFVQVYQNLGAEADGIVSIHISQKLSGTYNSAFLGRDAAESNCRIEVIDSFFASMGLGHIVIEAAKAAQAGADCDQVVAVTRDAISRTHFFGTVDTLEYLHKGGRIGKASVLLGTLLSIRPVLYVRDGEVHPWGKERTRKKALNRIFEIVKDFKTIKEVSVLHSTTPSEAAAFTERIGEIFDKGKVIQARIGPVIGTYLGPGAITVGVVE